MKNVDVGPQKGTWERRNYFHGLVRRVTDLISDKRTKFEVNKCIKQEHEIYKLKKKAILKEIALLERAHMKLVSLHKDAMKEHCKKPSNVKILFTGQEHLNDLSKGDKGDDEDKSDQSDYRRKESDESEYRRKETNDFLATMLSGFLEATSRHLPSIDPRPRPRSPKYETLLKYTFSFYFFIIVCNNANIIFFFKKKNNSNGKPYVRFM